MLKKILLVSLILLAPSTAFAAPVSWDFAGGILQPLQSAWAALVKADRFQATSTSAASIFPYASTTAISVSGLTPGNCVQAGTGGLLTTVGAACGSGSGGSAFPFTPGTGFGVNTQATSTALQLLAGVQASSTSYFATSTFYGEASDGFRVFSSAVNGHSALIGNTSAGNGAAHLSFCTLNTTGCAVTDGGDYGIDSSSNLTILNHENAGFKLTVNNATEALTVLSNGNVGIGSTTPYKKLSVVGDAQVSNYLSVGSSTGVAQLPNFLGDFVGNQDAYVTLNLGNNSAGTSASADLTFNNNRTAATGGLGYYTDCGYNSTTYTNATYTGFNQPSQFYCYNTDGPLSFFAASSTGPSYLSFGTGGTAAANERLRITSTGNIGVGSTSPWAQLSVNPNGIAGPSFAIGSSTGTKFVVTREGYVGIGTSNPLPGSLGRATLVINDPTGANGNELRFTGANTAGKIYTNSSQFGFITETNDREIVISAGGSGSGVNIGANSTTRISVLGNTGNVGISSTTPWGAFSINPNAIGTAPAFVIGSSTATNFIVTNSGSVGVGTTSPTKTFSVNGETYNNSTTTTQGLNVFAPTTGTSTQYIYSKTAGFGGQIILEDTDAAGCTQIYTLNGAISSNIITCPTEL